MNTLDESAPSFLERLLARAKRAAVRRELLARNDRELADIGVSRALLERGVAAWPWREAVRGESHPAPAAASRTGDRDRAPGRLFSGWPAANGA